MLTGEVVVTVYGHPRPKGSMKCVGGRGGRHQLVNSSKDVALWQQAVENQARKANQSAEPGQPVTIRATITVQRPLSHYGTGKNLGVLKASSESLLPVGRGTGDSDKHARLLLDALQNAGVLHEDAQVVDVRVVKVYTETFRLDALNTPGVVVRVRPAVTA